MRTCRIGNGNVVPVINPDAAVEVVEANENENQRESRHHVNLNAVCGIAVAYIQEKIIRDELYPIKIETKLNISDVFTKANPSNFKANVDLITGNFGLSKVIKERSLDIVKNNYIGNLKDGKYPDYKDLSKHILEFHTIKNVQHRICEVKPQINMLNTRKLKKKKKQNQRRKNKKEKFLAL
jgi:hypothetical protein